MRRIKPTNHANRRMAIITMLLLTVAVIACLVYGRYTPAAAGSLDCWGCWEDYHKPRPRKRKIITPRRAEPRGYRDPVWEIEFDDDGVKRPQCVPEVIEAIGSEHTTADTSMEAARKQWEWTTQFKWGSDYMTLEIARDFRAKCTKSDAMETFTGKLNEQLSSAVGKEGYNQRCIIRARPCRAFLERAEGHR